MSAQSISKQNYNPRTKYFGEKRLVKEDVILPGEEYVKRDIFQSLRRRTTETLVKNVEELAKIVRPTNLNNEIEMEKYESSSNESTDISEMEEISKTLNHLNHDLGDEEKSFNVRNVVSNNFVVRSMLFDFPRTKRLPKFEATVMASVLQQTLEDLELLKYVIDLSLPNRDSTANMKNYTNLSISPVAAKLQKDRDYVYNILKEVMLEIKCHRHYYILIHEINTIGKTEEREKLMKKNYAVWHETAETLRNVIEQNKVENEKEYKERLKMTDDMKVEVDRSTFFNGAKLEYIKKWESSRLEQEKLRAVRTENKLENEIVNSERKGQIEDGISEEIRSFLQRSITEMEFDIEMWTRKFDQQFEQLQQDIHDLQELKEEQKIELEQFYSLQKDRQAFIDECFAKTKIVKKDEEYETAVNEAALVIQSLWRGFMVRHRLGRYKKMFKALKSKRKKKGKKKK